MPDNAIHKRLFGRIAVKLKFIGEAQLEECLKIQQRESGPSGPPVLLGQIMKSRGYITDSQLETVLGVQKKLTMEREQCAWAQMGIAEAFGQIGNAREAIKEYNVVLEKYPEHFEICAQAKNRIAEHYRKLGEPQKSVDTLRRLLEDHEK